MPLFRLDVPFRVPFSANFGLHRPATGPTRAGGRRGLAPVTTFYFYESPRELCGRVMRVWRAVGHFIAPLPPSASFSTNITDNRFSTGTRWRLSLSWYTGRPCPSIIFYRLPQVRSVARYYTLACPRVLSIAPPPGAPESGLQFAPYADRSNLSALSE